jgi:hypothetical protein
MPDFPRGTRFSEKFSRIMRDDTMIVQRQMSPATGQSH